MIGRRGFLGAMFAAAAGPAIVRADSLMRIAPERLLPLWGDGIHDDRAALQQRLDKFGTVQMGCYAISGTLYLRRSENVLRGLSIHSMPGFAGGHLLEVAENSRATIASVHFDARNVRSLIA